MGSRALEAGQIIMTLRFNVKENVFGSTEDVKTVTVCETNPAAERLACGTPEPYP